MARELILKLFQKNESLSVNSVDITSSSLFDSKQFQIFPGDIIIVNANNARVKNAGIIEILVIFKCFIFSFILTNFNFK